ncbi:MAG: replication initiator protein WhiP [Sulfolobaceae archaeon]|nr:replication initiator protein WhiP [Sulfolobaceae archaeon]
MKDSDDKDDILINEEEIVNRGVKGAPRSKLMDAIILLLYSKPLRTSEIAVNLGYSTKYISSYLSYWKRKGLVYQEGGRWYLTAEGEDLAKEILDELSNTKFKEMLGLAKHILMENVNQTKNNKNRQKEDKKQQGSLSFVVGLTKSKDKKQQKPDFTECLADLFEKLTEEEIEILNYMINRYIQWNSTYVYLDQIQEELNADHEWLVRILRNLQTKKLVYLYHDPKLGTRVGFSQALKQRIESC